MQVHSASFMPFSATPRPQATPPRFGMAETLPTKEEIRRLWDKARTPAGLTEEERQRYLAGISAGVLRQP